VSKRTKFLLGIGVIAALVIGWQVAALANFPAGHVLLSLPGSDFEIDADANLQVDHTGDVPPPPATPLPEMIDWQNEGANTFRSGVDWKADSDSGPLDESFGQGTKEDTAEPVVVNGSIPPNKSDLKAFGIYEEEDAFLNLFWSRVQDPSGTTNMDFELNQNYCDPDNVDPDVCASNGLTPDRTVNDILITYDLSRGGTVATISIRKWDGSKWGPATELTAQNPVEAAGSINTSSIASSALGSLSPRTFGEAQVTFDALFGAGGCGSFGSAYLKSRSSDSFTAALKDFVPPQQVSVSNCPSGLTTNAQDSATVGQTIQDVATLDLSEAPNTTGTIEFKLYRFPAGTDPSTIGADDCIDSGTGANLVTTYTSTKDVPDDATGTNSDTYTSDPFTTTEVGVYQWVATFNPDQTGVTGDSTDCGDTAEVSVVANAPTTISSTQTWVPRDSATINHGGGTVTFTLLKGVLHDDCVNNPYNEGDTGFVYTTGALNVPAGSGSQTVSTTSAETQPAPIGISGNGTYRWQIKAAGPAGFDPATFCKETTVLTINDTTG
jgi:hypothetical protein